MSKSILFTTLFLLGLTTFAQKQTYDLLTHTPPKGWAVETKANTYKCFTIINGKKNEYCRIFIMASINSKGTVKENFKSEWQTLVKSQYNNTSEPQPIEGAENNGWNMLSSNTPFTANGAKGFATLTTMSGNNKALSILVLTNTQTYNTTVAQFMSSIVINNSPTTPDKVKDVVSTISNNKAAFTTTNFDDGWVSVAKEDWVQVTKGNIKVLLHYPKEGTIFPADPDPLTRAAWDILVAPRYSNLKNFKTTYISTYERPYIGFGTAKANESGKDAYVVLFRQGSTGWIEIIAPDKNTFIQNFQVDLDQIQWDSETDLLKPIAKMQNYNKFAIAASDFTGKWNDRFSSNTYYTNIYTGNSAGMSTYSSSQSFEFTGGSYKWHLVAVNSYGGASTFGQGKGSGTFKILNNWQINFSEMEGKPKTFDAYFSFVKGGRILWMNDAKFPGNGVFTGFKNEK